MPMLMHNSHVNVSELKLAMIEKLGLERARRYFWCLERFLSRRLSKTEFDKLCSAALGGENVALHNQLIRIILQNGHLGKIPPLSRHGKNALKAAGEYEGSIYPYRNSVAGSYNNGIVTSPHDHMLGARGRSYIDRPGPLGLISHDNIRKVNGHIGLAVAPSKRPRIEKLSQDGRLLTSNNCERKPVMEDDMEKDDQARDTYLGRALLAPLGIQPRSVSLRGSCRRLALSGKNTTLDTFHCYDEGNLNEELKRRMEHMAKVQGLVGVSLDSSSLLNNALDLHLTRLIKSCIELARSRSGYEPTNNLISSNLPHGKVVNGMWQGNYRRILSRSGISEGLSETRNQCSVSFQDFKIAMQLNPQQLGKDWPFLLEEISICSSDE